MRVVVKRPVLQPSLVDGRSRNPLFYYLVVAWLVPQETAAVSAQVLCTPFN